MKRWKYKYKTRRAKEINATSVILCFFPVSFLFLLALFFAFLVCFPPLSLPPLYQRKYCNFLNRSPLSTSLLSSAVRTRSHQTISIVLALAIVTPAACSKERSSGSISPWCGTWLTNVANPFLSTNSERITLIITFQPRISSMEK